MAVSEAKTKALGVALAQIENQFGEGSIMQLSIDSRDPSVEVISTGSLALDSSLGIGGLPRGRVVEIYGPESSGKTTVALQVIAEAQALGLQCAFIDAEHALDSAYASNLRVNLENLLISQPNSGEQALEICDSLVQSGAVDVIVIDSVAALTPKAEIEGEIGASLPGLQARLMSQALRELTGAIKRNNVLVIFINQTRVKLGAMFGSPETTTGGNALKFYASIRLDIRSLETLKQGDEAIGNMTKVKVVKNTMAAPFKVAIFEIYFGKGLNRAGEILDLSVEHKLVDKNGAGYTYLGERMGQGRDNAQQFLRDVPAIQAKLEGKLRGILLKAVN